MATVPPVTGAPTRINPGCDPDGVTVFPSENTGKYIVCSNGQVVDLICVCGEFDSQSDYADCILVDVFDTLDDLERDYKNGDLLSDRTSNPQCVRER